MNSSNHPVDIVASRDLVRAFQRRIRGVVDIPASKLALDVIDALAETFEGADRRSLSSFAEKQQQPQNKKDEQPSPLRRGASGVNLRRSRPNPGQPHHHSSPSQKACLSLHDSLVAAVSSAEERDGGGGRQGAAGTRFRRAGSALSSSSSSVGSSIRGSAGHQEEANMRLQSAYKQHRAGLRTRLHPEPSVVRAQQQRLPLILERECNSVLRNAASARFCYFDSRVCDEDGIPIGARYAHGDDVAYDDCDVSLVARPEVSDSPGGGGGGGTLSKSNSTVQQLQHQKKQQQSKDHRTSPIKLRFKQREPVPIAERPHWTFVSPVDEHAAELLWRRTQAVTPPRPVSVPTPHEQKRRHMSPVVGTMYYQPCYEVE